MKQLPKSVRNELLKLLRGRSDADADVDELNSFFLQVVFALLLIFMCAFFLFMGKVDGEISRIDQMKEAIRKAEEAEILRAVEQVAEAYRIRYGLKEFLHIDSATGAKEYEFTAVIVNGKFQKESFAGKSFAQGAAAAAADYAASAELQQRWLDEINALAPEASSHNQKLVNELVTANIGKLKIEVIEVQTLAVASIQEYLALHPELIQDAGIRTLVQKITAEKDSAERRRLFSELTQQLENYVYGNLRQMCGCELLRKDK